MNLAFRSSHARTWLVSAPGKLIIALCAASFPSVAQAQLVMHTQSPLVLRQFTQPLVEIEPIQGMESVGQQVVEKLQILDSTGQHVITVNAGTQAVMNGSVGVGQFDNGGALFANTSYALHAIGGPAVSGALVYSTHRDVPDLSSSQFSGYTYSHRISEVRTDNTSSIRAFVQQGNQCLLLDFAVVGVSGNPGQSTNVDTSLFFPSPAKNRWVTVTSTSNGDNWLFHHGGYGSHNYVSIVGTGSNKNTPTFLIRVDANGLYTATRQGVTGDMTISCQHIGFWLNLDN